MERGIWWLASYPKSGNTWLRMFLNSYIGGVPANINAPFQLAQSDTHSPTLQATASCAVAAIPKEQVMLYRPATLANMVHLSRVQNPILKTHFANKDVDEIPAIPRQLTRGAVYLVRDPRDVAVSFSHHLNQSIDDVIDLMCEPGARMKSSDSDLFYSLSRWDTHVESWNVSHPSPVVIKYEDMLADPECEFRRVLEHMEIAVDEHRLLSAVKYSAFDKLSRQEDVSGFVEATHGKFFRQGTSGQWRESLTRKQSSRIENEFREVMEHFDYS